LTGCAVEADAHQSGKQTILIRSLSFKCHSNLQVDFDDGDRLLSVSVPDILSETQVLAQDTTGLLQRFSQGSRDYAAKQEGRAVKRTFDRVRSRGRCAPIWKTYNSDSFPFFQCHSNLQVDFDDGDGLPAVSVPDIFSETQILAQDTTGLLQQFSQESRDYVAEDEGDDDDGPAEEEDIVYVPHRPPLADQ